MKLTPKGKRFGDVVRQHLADPNSDLSKITRQFNAWKRLERSDSKTVTLILTRFGIKVVKNERFGSADSISAFDDMGFWWNRLDALAERMKA